MADSDTIAAGKLYSDIRVVGGSLRRKRQLALALTTRVGLAQEV